MRFGLDSSDDSDDDDLVSIASFSSEESDDIPGPSAPRQPRSALGKNIITYLDDTSDEDAGFGSEDEVTLIGGESISRDIVDLTTWRDSIPLSHSRRLPLYGGDARGGQTIPALKDYDVPEQLQGRLAEQHANREYENWLKENEEDAWLNGHRVAHERRGALRELSRNAKVELKEKQGMAAAKEAEDLRKMLEGMTIKHDQEQEEIKQRFAERSKKLWDDINAAILAAERREAEKQGVVLEADRKRKEEEAAKEKAEAAKKAAVARQATEAADRERLAREKLDTEKQRAQEAAQAAENARQADAGKSPSEKEWASWVEKQKWMKKEVIEKIKTDKETKTRLKIGMRLMTRSFGQMVNSRSKILQVTDDVHTILKGELPGPPSVSSPVIFSPDTPASYLYLLSHIAKALIKQATNEIAAKPDTAFPLAKVVLGLQLRGHAALGDVLFARVVKKCPWAVPHHPIRRPGVDREEYEKSTGRASDESIADYISRMVGILTLYFAIQQTSLSVLIPTLPTKPTPEQLVKLIPTPLRLPAAWTWLSYMLKEPMASSEPATALVNTWTKIAAPEVIRLYGRGQVGKVMRAVMEDGVERKQLGTDTESARQAFGIRLSKFDTWRAPDGRRWE